MFSQHKNDITRISRQISQLRKASPRVGRAVKEVREAAAFKDPGGGGGHAHPSGTILQAGYNTSATVNNLNNATSTTSTTANNSNNSSNIINQRVPTFPVTLTGGPAKGKDRLGSDNNDNGNINAINSNNNSNNTNNNYHKLSSVEVLPNSGSSDYNCNGEATDMKANIIHTEAGHLNSNTVLPIKDIRSVKSSNKTALADCKNTSPAATTSITTAFPVHVAQLITGAEKRGDGHQSSSSPAVLTPSDYPVVIDILSKLLLNALEEGSKLKIFQNHFCSNEKVDANEILLADLRDFIVDVIKKETNNNNSKISQTALENMFNSYAYYRVIQDQLLSLLSLKNELREEAHRRTSVEDALRALIAIQEAKDVQFQMGTGSHVAYKHGIDSTISSGGGGSNNNNNNNNNNDNNKNNKNNNNNNNNNDNNNNDNNSNNKKNNKNNNNNNDNNNNTKNNTKNNSDSIDNDDEKSISSSSSSSSSSSINSGNYLDVELGKTNLTITDYLSAATKDLVTDADNSNINEISSPYASNIATYISEGRSLEYSDSNINDDEESPEEDVDEELGFEDNGSNDNNSHHHHHSSNSNNNNNNNNNNSNKNNNSNNNSSNNNISNNNNNIIDNGGHRDYADHADQNKIQDPAIDMLFLEVRISDGLIDRIPVQVNSDPKGLALSFVSLHGLESTYIEPLIHYIRHAQEQLVIQMIELCSEQSNIVGVNGNIDNENIDYGNIDDSAVAQNSVQNFNKSGAKNDSNSKATSNLNTSSSPKSKNEVESEISEHPPIRNHRLGGGRRRNVPPPPPPPANSSDGASSTSMHSQSAQNVSNLSVGGDIISSSNTNSISGSSLSSIIRSSPKQSKNSTESTDPSPQKRVNFALDNNSPSSGRSTSVASKSKTPALSPSVSYYVSPNNSLATSPDIDGSNVNVAFSPVVDAISPILSSGHRPNSLRGGNNKSISPSSLLTIDELNVSLSPSLSHRKESFSSRDSGTSNANRRATHRFSVGSTNSQESISPVSDNSLYDLSLSLSPQRIEPHISSPNNTITSVNRNSNPSDVDSRFPSGSFASPPPPPPLGNAELSDTFYSKAVEIFDKASTLINTGDILGATPLYEYSLMLFQQSKLSPSKLSIISGEVNYWVAKAAEIKSLSSSMPSPNSKYGSLMNRNEKKTPTSSNVIKGRNREFML